MSKKSNYIAKQADANGAIQYSDEEHETWRILMGRQMPLVNQYACAEYLDALEKLSLPGTYIPQCDTLSKQLKAASGWQVAPVPALINFKTFFAMLANKFFPAASFIRSREELNYLQEPDIFHEIVGHTPLLTNTRFATFTQNIGQLGQQADESQYVWIARLYWFTVEFGLLNEKALGAGLISSFSELQSSVESDTPIRKPFDLMEVLRTPYRIDIHQPVYYVLESLDQLLELGKQDLLGAIEEAKKLGLHAPLYAETKS
ncbi:phenylalanine 4-monooxygenase [Leucothrix pacifica]|uniref:phenylalanine 4-monooxygenase n=1 Tax=Leucothrix pacifica TaxID=1247513 RepID=A0A317C1T1_9GAMM|nr:phenylalanine 4-monooxygenase [Leucothrix pacifica]PWQ92584.1 phenylalanine 4-monooxygenase [Leucothrix pacifica]